MKVVKFNEAESYEPEENWFRVSLAGSDAVSVEYYEKPPGHSSPMHSHAQKQVSIVIEGEMKAYSKENEVVLEKMDSVFFEANETHRIENVGDELAVGIDIFVPKRSFDFWEQKME